MVEFFSKTQRQTMTWCAHQPDCSKIRTGGTHMGTTADSENWVGARQRVRVELDVVDLDCETSAVAGARLC